MKLEDLTTIDQLVDFLSGTQAVAFSVISDKDACFRWVQGELVKFRYLRLSRQGAYVRQRTDNHRHRAYNAYKNTIAMVQLGAADERFDH
jgi:hypothetical protein